ncbi:putative oxidoreductase [Paucibacter oligotrophus]|uniref:Putative oxidoreductase n=1 Tax=Roseateles oligotrophus TaxID=1769250 RepID=A0A840L5S4_9BURK|nr:DoxX family protein [Roseateles oligotrophus]MBB4841539.1 putative oxidoreductase [Roseateles oligotrophus]
MNIALNAFTVLLRLLCDPGRSSLRSHAAPVWLNWVLAQAQSLALLLARFYLAQVFFLSGLSKLRDWSSTLALFEDEYQVPFLPPELAAYLGTAGELALPVLLVLGLGGRFAALGLSVVNLVAVASLSEIAPAALAGHQLWGVLLLAVALFGAGRFSVDALIFRVRSEGVNFCSERLPG